MGSKALLKSEDDIKAQIAEECRAQRRTPRSRVKCSAKLKALCKAATVAGASPEAVAKLAGVTTATIKRWLPDNSSGPLVRILEVDRPTAAQPGPSVVLCLSGIRVELYEKGVA